MWGRMIIHGGEYNDHIIQIYQIKSKMLRDKNMIENMHKNILNKISDEDL